MSTGIADGLAFEQQLFRDVFATEDAAAGVQSFLEEGPGKARFSVAEGYGFVPAACGNILVCSVHQRPPAGAGGHHRMGIGVSIFLLAVGAILTFALETEVSGIDLDTVGIILMIVGIIGMLFSAMFWNSWGGFGGRRPGGTTVVRDREVI